MKYLYDALPDELKGAYTPDSTELSKIIKEEIASYDTILIKGSHGSKMQVVLDELLCNK
jgi:UDP-N-acetylmuramoyl-tripeptide--D-alanyl-D-alanine ligase